MTLNFQTVVYKTFWIIIVYRDLYITKNITLGKLLEQVRFKRKIVEKRSIEYREQFPVQSNIFARIRTIDSLFR